MVGHYIRHPMLFAAQKVLPLIHLEHHAYQKIDNAILD